MSKGDYAKLVEPLVEKPQHYDEEEQAAELVKPTAVLIQSKKTKRGMPCLCKWLLIVVSVLLVLFVSVCAYSYYLMSEVVEDFTVKTPLPKFPTVHMTDAELDLVQDRVKMFVDELRVGNKNNRNNKELIVTQDELNGFISHSDFLRGNALIRLEDNAIKEQWSLPAEFLPGGKGRYFVANSYLKLDPATDKFQVDLETSATHEDWFDGPLLFAKLHYLINADSLWELYLDQGSFFGIEATEDFINVNIFEDVYDDPDAHAILTGIESVTIAQGKIIVKARGNNSSTGGVVAAKADKDYYK